MKLNEKVWIFEKNNNLEINPLDNECTINIGCNQIVNIDKLYGPLCAELIRVRLEYNGDISDWVVERQNVVTNKWEEKIRWDCQESYPDDEPENNK